MAGNGVWLWFWCCSAMVGHWCCQPVSKGRMWVLSWQFENSWLMWHSMFLGTCLLVERLLVIYIHVSRSVICHLKCGTVLQMNFSVYRFEIAIRGCHIPFRGHNHPSKSLWSIWLKCRYIYIYKYNMYIHPLENWYGHGKSHLLW